MGRPTKTGLDYFPLDVNIDDNLELVEAEHGLQGFAIVVKLWQKIYSNGYFIEWNDDTILLFSKKINSEITVLNSVVNSCLRRKIFDENLFIKYGILTSSGIQKRFLTACSQSKRKSIIFINEFSLVNSEFTGFISELIPLNPEESAQRKEEESKTKENKYERFDFFWILYEKDKGKEDCKTEFLKLSENEIEKILIHVPKYVKSTSDINFRKDPINYLNNKCWNDEIIERKTSNQQQNKTPGKTVMPHFQQPFKPM